MHIAVIGLGRMGGNLARLAISKGHVVTGYSATPGQAQALAAAGVQPATSLEALVKALPAPRVILLYVPHGEPTEQVCAALLPLLAAGDIVADGGNSHWDDSRRRAATFAEQGIHFLDVGTSGGIQGASNGACFMAGGHRAAFDVIEPLLVDLAQSKAAVLHTGPAGSGHFAKIVHNAIEFGMVQAIGEGVELLSRSDFPYDLHAIFDNWSHGSVIRGWLVELMRDAIAAEPHLEALSTYVEDTQEVKWILKWALEHDIPLPVAYEAQTALMEYRDVDWPAAKAVALLRHGYGGHPVHRAGQTMPR